MAYLVFVTEFRKQIQPRFIEGNRKFLPFYRIINKQVGKIYS